MPAAHPRFIAFYLPQYHPIPENDRWWGKGFTEWTNVAKAVPRFRRHYQPHVPADLGFYDLRVPETRIAQAEMAREYGIEAFCYYHYWFSGKRLLERPFNEVLESGVPAFPFCLCWANETWTGIWHGARDRILIEQTYSDQDDVAHFTHVLRAFRDARYLRVDGKPVFFVYQPLQLPNPSRFAERWRELAHKAGLEGLYLVGMQSPGDWNPKKSGFDGCVNPKFPGRRPPGVRRRHFLRWAKNKYEWKAGIPSMFPYEDLINIMFEFVDPALEKFPCVVPNWDNSPRSGVNGLVLVGSSPDLFRLQVRKALDLSSGLQGDKRLIFIKSWNEWAEGNHLEPDLKFGTRYLEVIREEIDALRSFHGQQDKPSEPQSLDASGAPPSRLAQ